MRTETLVAKNSGKVAHCRVAVTGFAIAEELTDTAENVVALGLVNRNRLWGRRGFTLGPFRFGNDLLVLGLRGGRRLRGLYAKGGDSGADCAVPADKGTDFSTILISSGVRP